MSEKLLFGKFTQEQWDHLVNEDPYFEMKSDLFRDEKWNPIREKCTRWSVWGLAPISFLFTEEEWRALSQDDLDQIQSRANEIARQQARNRVRDKWVMEEWTKNGVCHHPSFAITDGDKYGADYYCTNCHSPYSNDNDI